MDMINAVAAILTIITSGISIYLFVSERRRRGNRPPARPADAVPSALPPCKPKAAVKSDEAEAGRPASSDGVERTLHKIAAGFWGVLGFACLSEGLTYGDGILLLLAGLFFWLAYKLWPKSGTAVA